MVKTTSSAIMLVSECSESRYLVTASRVPSSDICPPFPSVSACGRTLPLGRGGQNEVVVDPRQWSELRRKPLLKLSQKSGSCLRRSLTDIRDVPAHCALRILVKFTDRALLVPFTDRLFHAVERMGVLLRTITRALTGSLRFLCCPWEVGCYALSCSETLPVVLDGGDKPSDDRDDQRQELDPRADQYSKPARIEQVAQRAACEEPDEQKQPYERADNRGPPPRQQSNHSGHHIQDYETWRRRITTSGSDSSRW